MKHEPMTQERLEAIRARLADVGAIWKYAATPTGDGEVITVGQEGPIAWGIDIDSAALDAALRGDMFRNVEPRWVEWMKLFLAIIPFPEISAARSMATTVRSG